MIFDQLQATRQRFRIRADQVIEVPAYAGSMLRGGFGHALRRVICVLKHNDCRACLLRERCVYVMLFEAGRSLDHQQGPLAPVVPQPYILEPPLGRKRLLAPGETLEFGLVLVGAAIEYLSYFIYAFNILGERGLGRGRGRFRLESVATRGRDGWTEVYSAAKPTIATLEPDGSGAWLAERTRELAAGDRVTLNFLTPTRIKGDGRWLTAPEFPQLLKALLRRLSGLSRCHCGHLPQFDVRALIAAAERVRRTATRLQWTDHDRYSFRQHQRMNLGGFTGQVSYQGNLAPFAEALAWGEVLHVGKAASFGLGQYELIAA